MDQLDNQALKVLLELLDEELEHQVLQVSPVPQVRTDSMELQEKTDSTVALELVVALEHQVELELQDLRVTPEHQAHQVYQEVLDQ